MPTAAFDIIALFMEDHEKLQRLFARFARIKGGDDDAERRAIVEVACTELVIHATVEEELLYPALREALERQDLLDEAEVENKIARQLIDELELMEPGDHLYDAKFFVLSEYQNHHMNEEQNRIFPLIGMADLDFADLLGDIKQRRFELRSGFGLPDHAYDDDGRFQMRIAPSVRH
ncbi:MAG: hemerythrin domain-containing protein [Janthinobacterium lividum]